MGEGDQTCGEGDQTCRGGDQTCREGDQTLLYLGLSAEFFFLKGLTDFYKEAFNICSIQCACLFEDGIDRTCILFSSFVRNLKQPIRFRYGKRLGRTWEVGQDKPLSFLPGHTCCQQLPGQCWEALTCEAL